MFQKILDMSELKIYNSYTREKEVFKPITEGHVGLYVCGPTVSGESHLGHCRPYVTFDVVNRYLQHLGYNVRYVRNITDAGHFEEEGREAQDKVAEKAKLEKLEPMELVQKYTNLFHWGMRELNNLEPSIEPTATGHIVEQIDMIQTIMEKGYAYEVNGSIYFDLDKYSKEYPYGKLSGRIIDELLETTRELDGQDEKRNKIDFALWKKAPEEHLMRWTSPWGDGFPGWHIECSAMSSKYLGEQFDIHGGGMDLQFPHHESEIAQSNIAHDCMPVNYWMHNNMITINGKKMGKSYNNVISITELFSGTHELLDQPYHPMVIRFNILQTHYRSTLDFSNEALQASGRAFERLWEAYQNLLKLDLNNFGESTVEKTLEEKLENHMQDCHQDMKDDFNTAKVLASLFEMTSTINSLYNSQLKPGQFSRSLIEKMQNHFEVFIEDILGLKSMKDGFDQELIDGLMNIIIDIRGQSREKKDYATSDLIRDKLNELGIQLKDGKDGVGYDLP